MNKLAVLVIVALLTISGCNSISETPSQTEINSTKTTETHIEITVGRTSPTHSPTETSTPEFSTEQKLDAFRDGYIGGLEENGVNIVNNSLNTKTETLFITYEMRDPESDEYTGNERENISFGYVVGVEHYLDENHSDQGETWIPKQVNVTAVTPEGEIYETAYITYERTKKMIDGEISERRYLLEYYATTEFGPANPEFEG